MTVHQLLHPPLIGARDGGQQANRAIEVGSVQPHDRDIEGGAVLDEHAAVAIEQHAARRPQRQLALVVVLRHLLELRVLDDLEEPEARGEHGEQHHRPHAEDHDAGR
jgi:hypothetical protein